ncbi:broad specificity phosphatase PhoE [Herbihabitans rhizosphaerae]|uniref:Broad specificity phosphatase PhoE n=1 Tax=Herbihabitans rhizosphaerae TaxID=1872711 RepID=A0A4Q7L260_9PSEU|nr:histidine phosphatase family protein [Herbihabitans rhizosphaerae]RZS43619.1 broad specificity phosphatase PhoE [Herbihabitans rhizosphaerae]
MTTRLSLISPGVTEATRRAAFPADEPLLDHTPVAADLGRLDAAWHAPALRCVQTAGVLGLDTIAEPALDGWRYGSWAGRTITELAESDPGLAAAWRADPDFSPPGGESLRALLRRAVTWMDALPGEHRRLAAVADGSMIKAAVVHAIAGTPESLWRLDIRPFTVTVLHTDGRRWSLRAIGQPLNG